MTRIGVFGAAGKMGRFLIESVLAHPHTTLSAAIDRPGSGAIGADAGALTGGQDLGVALTDQVDGALQGVDVMLDFSRPEGALALLAQCRAAGVAMVIGTTGFDSAGKQAIAAAAADIPIVFAANYSVGVNLCLKLLQLSAPLLQDDFDIEIIEAHHRHKVDAPSGTALAMGEVIAAACRSEQAVERRAQLHAPDLPRPSTVA